MNEAKLRAYIYTVLNQHFFSHKGRCECGEIVSLKAVDLMQHIEDKLVEKLMSMQKELME